MDIRSDQVLAKKIEQFGAGVERLNEVIHPEVDTEYRNDAVIQRFEFCYEMAWKLLKRLLEDKGVIENTPKDVLKSAFAVGYLGQDSDGWYSMIKARNLSSHVYTESVADEIVEMVESKYLHLFQELRKSLKAADYGD